MADIVGPLRPADSWSTTEVRTVTHNHVWTIKGFSQCDCRYLETTCKVKDVTAAASMFSPPTSQPGGSATVAEVPTITFRIRLHPQGNKESNKDFTFFQCFSNGPGNSTFKSRFKFTVFNSRNEEVQTTVYTGTQQLHGYFEYIRRDLLIQHVMPQDELQLNLEISVTFDTVTRTSQTPKQAVQLDPKPCEVQVSKDIEQMFKDAKLSDFVINIGNKEIPVHRVVLSARSPVFAAMLEAHTEEAQTGRVDIEDVDYEVMHELLVYVYSGRSPNLSSMGLELLAAADRFQLPGLKSMADHTLRTNLHVESVCRNLVFADMYNSEGLKNEAVKFIAYNVTNIISTDGYQELSRDHPHLVTEILTYMADKRPSGNCHTTNTSVSLSTIHPTGPPLKRARLDGSSID